MENPKRQTPSGWDDADWSEIRQAIVVASAAWEIEEEMSAETIKRIWARRAEQLAEVPEVEAAGERLQIVPLRLGREVYGVDAQCITDIRPVAASEITRVPRVPPWVAGVANLRGRIYSVLDLGRYLGVALADAAPVSETSQVAHASRHTVTGAQAPVKQRKPPPRAGGPGRRTTTGYLVVVETPAMETALLVDEVLPIEVVPASRIDEASGSVRGVRSEYVRGIASGQQLHHDASGRSLVILDLLALLGDGRLIVYDELG